MFLSVLDKEGKTKFLEFAYAVANIDRDYAEEEQQLINSYQIETGILELPAMTNSIDELITYFAAQNTSVKKIVFFEIYGMLLTDNRITSEEKELFTEIESKFGIPSETLDAIKDLIKELQDLYDKIYDVCF